MPTFNSFQRGTSELVQETSGIFGFGRQLPVGVVVADILNPVD